jgi:hypothetical protein
MTETTFLELPLPTVGGDQDEWGGKLNEGIQKVADAIQSLVEAGNYAAASGVDTITVGLDPAPSTYVTGLNLRFKAAGANTTAPTLNVNSLGAKSIKYPGGTALAAGALVSGVIYEVNYDGTDFIMAGAVGGPAATADVTTGTDDTKFITPAVLASLLSFANPGHFRLPGGVIMWGLNTVGTDSQVDVSLPVTLANTTSAAVLVAYNGTITPVSGTAILGVQGKLNSTSSLKLSNDNVSAQMSWVVIGPVA